MVLYGTSVIKERVVATASRSKRREEGGDETAVRERILDAAFAAFMKSGYARTRFEARALHTSWQQTGNADRLHPRARRAVRRAR